MTSITVQELNVSRISGTGIHWSKPEQIWTDCF